MTEDSTRRLVVDKALLRSEFRGLQRALEEYQGFLAQADDGGDWEAGAVTHLRTQQLALLQARVSLGTGELACALLRKVLERVAVRHLRFHPRPTPSQSGAGASEPVGPRPELGRLMTILQEASQSAPLEQQEQLQRLLAGVLDFLSALAAQNAEQIDAAIGRINLATATTQSRTLLREIALATRDIYETLRSVSEDLPLDALSASSGGIGEAVQRLNSVVARLDDAATQNLDHLEVANRIVHDEERTLGEAMAALREAQQRLMRIKAAHPALEPALTGVQNRLSDDAGAALMALQHQMREAGDMHLELISNQSFHELTGRTLKRIIDFVLTLEAQLADLLAPYRPGGAPAGARPPAPAKAPGDAPAAALPASGPASSQEDVDKLLGELGF